MVKTETLYLRNTNNEKYHIINSMPPEFYHHIVFIIYTKTYLLLFFVGNSYQPYFKNIL